MNRWLANRLAFVMLTTIAGCGIETKPKRPDASDEWQVNPTHVDGTNALAYVRELVKITPRHSGSPGALEAAMWIRDTIAPFAEDVHIDTFTDKSPDGPIQFHNVVATLKGTANRTVILGSHFDTKAGISNTFQGANDSGSSTGLLIELARLLNDAPPPPFSIEFTFFDGEECRYRYSPIDGLHGSRYRVRQLQQQKRLSQVKAVILLDMIGDRDLTMTMPRNVDQQLLRHTLNAARMHGLRDVIKLSRMTIIDDHVPFRQAGVPVMNLIDFEFGSKSGANDLWHTDADHLDAISANSLNAAGRITLQLLNLLATEYSTPQP